MSVIEDTRKLIQDFLAPELREIAARIDALEARFGIQDKRIAERFDTQEKYINARFSAVDQRFSAVDKRFDEAEHRASERHAQVLEAITRLGEVYELRERVARIEAREKAN
jgi:hypothetical protein